MDGWLGGLALRVSSSNSCGGGRGVNCRSSERLVCLGKREVAALRENPGKPLKAVRVRQIQDRRDSRPFHGNASHICCNDQTLSCGPNFSGRRASAARTDSGRWHDDTDDRSTAAARRGRPQLVKRASERKMSIMGPPALAVARALRPGSSWDAAAWRACAASSMELLFGEGCRPSGAPHSRRRLQSSWRPWSAARSPRFREALASMPSGGAMVRRKKPKRGPLPAQDRAAP